MPHLENPEIHQELPAQRGENETIEFIRLNGTLRSVEALKAALQVRLTNSAATPPVLPAVHMETLRETVKNNPPPPPGTSVIVPTSGSTGQPKLTCLDRTALVASIEATATRLGGHGSWLLALPATHIAGVQVILRALHGSGALELMDLTTSFTAQRFTAATQRLVAQAPHGPYYTSLVPTQVHRMLASADSYPHGIAALRTFDAILVGGAHLDAGLLAQAQDLGIALVTTYGMSETAGGCVYNGSPLDGVELRLEDVDPTTGVGRVHIHGPMLALGYLGQETGFTGTEKRWFATSDLGRFSSTDTPDARPRLEILGRFDDLIVSGGAKIAPLAVEAAVSSLDEITEAIAVGIADREWGHALVVIVTTPAESTSGTELHLATAELSSKVRDKILATLGREATPSAIFVTAELPHLASGKPDRRTLQTLVEERFFPQRT